MYYYIIEMKNIDDIIIIINEVCIIIIIDINVNDEMILFY